ncbi:MAG: hypothetical protein U5K51_06235 [Flavobacteriaceae bacterium]|nr:hypothetical protein [Flavobacteriaceae bacterium]
MAESPYGKRPYVKTGIPTLQAGQTIVYRASLNVTEPAYALNQNELVSSVCNFTGNDILVISTKDDETCWQNRIDVIGTADQWSGQMSYVRKYGCEAAGPKTYFDSKDWLNYETVKVNQAEIGYNLRIGQHFTGPATFENAAWKNGKPDIHRAAIIKDDYNTASNGNVSCCSMTIEPENTVKINENGYLTIQKELKVDGELQIENNASLLCMIMTERLIYWES